MLRLCNLKVLSYFIIINCPHTITISAGYVRFMFAIMLCIANMIIYGLKVNISTAIIGMVKSKPGAPDWSDECPEFTPTEELAPDIDGPFDWTAHQQALVISIYFAGYLIGMFPSGYFADR